MVDEVPEEHSRGKGPSRVHSSTGVVHLKHKSLVTGLCCKICILLCVYVHGSATGFFYVPYPHEMSNSDGEANGEGSRSQTSVSPLIGYSENAHHELHGEENLHSSGHSKAYARLQLEIQMDKVVVNFCFITDKLLEIFLNAVFSFSGILTVVSMVHLD